MEAPQAASSGRRQGGLAVAIWVALLAIAIVAIAVASLHLVQEVRLDAGAELLYSIEPPAPGDPDEATRAQTIAEIIAEIIEKRIREYGLQECCVVPAPGQRLRVLLPGLAGAQLATVKRLLSASGRLEFRLVASQRSNVHQTWINSGKVNVPPGYMVYKIVEHKKEEGKREGEVLVCNKVEMTGESISRARITTPGSGTSLRPAIGLSFTRRGEREFAIVTGENVGERLAIILNSRRDTEGDIIAPGTCYSAPVIRTRIVRDAVIDGDFALEEANMVRTVLASGSLPAPIHLENETVIPCHTMRRTDTKAVCALIIAGIVSIVSLAGLIRRLRRIKE